MNRVDPGLWHAGKAAIFSGACHQEKHFECRALRDVILKNVALSDRYVIFFQFVWLQLVI